MADEITIKLRNDEALVLFEWFARLEDQGRSLTEHPAEQKVLWRIHGQLESTLVEPFMHGYNALVEKARKSVEAT